MEQKPEYKFKDNKDLPCLLSYPQEQSIQTLDFFEN